MVEMEPGEKFWDIVVVVDFAAHGCLAVLETSQTRKA